MHAGGAFVFLAKFFNQTAGYQILELLISTQAQHLLAAAHRVAQFQVRKDALEKIIETEYFLLGENIHKFIGHMIR